MALLWIMETQFVAARNRDKAKHRFIEFLAENGVKHIVARVSQPKTNGKIERFLLRVSKRELCGS